MKVDGKIGSWQTAAVIDAARRLAEELNSLSRSSREDKWEAMGGLIDDDVLSAFAVVAEPDGVAAEIRRRFGGLADRVSFYAPYDIDPEAWELALHALKSPAGS